MTTLIQKIKKLIIEEDELIKEFQIIGQYAFSNSIHHIQGKINAFKIVLKIINNDLDKE